MQAHKFELFYSRFHSRFAPGVAPDSRSNPITLYLTLSLSLLIALFWRGLFDAGDGFRKAMKRAPPHHEEDSRLPPHRSLPQLLIIRGDAIGRFGRCARSVRGHDAQAPPAPEPSRS